MTDSPFALLVNGFFFVASSLVIGLVFGHALRVIAIALVDTVAYMQDLWRSRD